MAEIEKIAADRYRIRSHEHLLTVDAQDLRDIYDYALLHMRELESEARIAEALARNQAMELAPNEIEAEQAYQETQDYMEHHYLGGEGNG